MVVRSAGSSNATFYRIPPTNFQRSREKLWCVPLAERDLHERNHVIAQALVARWGDQVVILDPQAADAFDIKSGFERHDIAGTQRFRRVANDERRFGMFQP